MNAPSRLRSALLIVLAIGCGHAAQRTAAVPTAAAKVDVAYTLTLVHTPSTMVRVDVETTGDPGGVTTFDLGDGWGGVEHPENEVHDFTARVTGGAPLVVTHDAGHRWVVNHAPSQRVTATYYLTSSRQALGSDASPAYRAITSDHLIHLIGQNALVVPQHLASAATLHLALRWRGFAEAGWTFVSSFGAHVASELDESLEAFRQAVFVASDDLRLTTRRAGAGTLVVGVVGRWPWTDAELAEVAGKIIAAERAFFADPGPPWFLITVIPIGEYDPHSSSLGGTGLTRSFATFLSPRSPLDQQVRWLLGHELFHSWNGQTIMPEPPDELAYWFTEGFTNFYARRLLYRAGLLSLTTYVENLEQEIHDYRSSPARNEPNARIQAAFWKSRDLEKLPYLRGDLIALLVDREISRTSNHARSLDDLMRELVAGASTHGATVTTDKLLARIAHETSAAFAARLRATIVDGATLDLPLDTLAPCLTATTKEIGPFELGFDEQRARDAHIVSGLIAGSRAEAAGLRDGDTLTSFSAYLGDPTREVTLAIERAGKRQTLQYLPQGALVTVPVFAVGDPDACKTML